MSQIILVISDFCDTNRKFEFVCISLSYELPKLAGIIEMSISSTDVNYARSRSHKHAWAGAKILLQFSAFLFLTNAPLYIHNLLHLKEPKLCD